MKKKLIIIVPIVLAVLVFLGVLIYYNYEDRNTSLNVADRRWISANSTKRFDLEIINNIPVYSMNGSGVVFSFVESLKRDTGLDFNKISYLKEAEPSTNGLRFRILDNTTDLTVRDLLLFEDGYVMVSKDDIRYDRVSDISDKTVGIFASDAGEVSYYLRTANRITYQSVANIETLMNDFESGNIDAIIVPQILYLDKILSNENYHINYYFTEMSRKIVLTLSDDNEPLNRIITKYFNRWKNDRFVDIYNREFLNHYISVRGINDRAKADLLSRSYVYGYVENRPYEVTINKVPSGIASEYVARLRRLTGIDFEYRRFDNINALKKAISAGEVDIYFNHFDFSPDNFKSTVSPFVEEYYVLGNFNNGINIKSFESLKGVHINMLDDNTLLRHFEGSSRAKISKKQKVGDLTRNNNIIVVDSEIYKYYKNSKLLNYEILYIGEISNDYTFEIKKDDENFFKLFDFMITTNSYYNYRNNGLRSLNVSFFDRGSFQEIYLLVLAVALLPLLALLLIYLVLKRKNKIKEIKKEDRRKYTDVLTSLKNRNYLSLNMETWDESKVYPQAIVIIDLNNVKYVNDNYGHEAGDALIVAAASTLVNTQLENSEIMRIDGNEFLIYLVGYTDKQVDTYCKKLAKELKQLPHEFGAAIGYSIIADDIKTIDDAINEAALDMRESKEKVKEEK